MQERRKYPEIRDYINLGVQLAEEPSPVKRIEIRDKMYALRVTINKKYSHEPVLKQGTLESIVGHT